MRELAVDFGTSNTVAALRTQGGPARLLLFDGWPVLPSAVLRGRDGTLVVGQEALRGARLDPARFEPHPKERIDDGQVLLGDAAVPVVSLIAAVLRRVAAEAPAPDRVVLTHPADWYSSRRAVLLEAAREAGWHGDVQLVAEPVAAATQAADVPPGQALAVFDMGGGTTDVAVLRRTGTGWDVLAEAGLPDFGGRDLDHLLLEHLGAELNRPSDAAGRRAARALAEDVRAGKEALSQYTQTDIPLPHPLPDAHLTRQELETLVEPALRRAVELLAKTVGTTPITAVYLVGGATRMPLVARLISQRIGLLPTIVDSPETSVALGALGPAPVIPQWTPIVPPPPSLPKSTPMPVPPPEPKQSTAAVVTAIGLVVLALGAVTVAALLRPDTVGTATPIASTPVSVPSSAPPEPAPAAFREDEQLIAFAGPAAAKADDCVNALGTNSQGDMYQARNHVRCRFEVDGVAYFANYLSSDDAQTCQQLNQEFVDLPDTRWLSEAPWSGGELTGKSHDIETPSGNTVLWYADTNSLCAFFGAGTDHNPSMADVHQAWKTVVGA
ncbi:Hsp70 family protein [Amycolatopsis magusensis]|uniref:Hsp70 family protein n=1 Tax=Amycolatopsis magusensis TaxID=882444 RepID=UPI003788E779